MSPLSHRDRRPVNNNSLCCMPADEVASLYQAGIISAHEAFIETSNTVASRQSKEQRRCCQLPTCRSTTGRYQVRDYRPASDGGDGDTRHASIAESKGCRGARNVRGGWRHEERVEVGSCRHGSYLLHHLQCPIRRRNSDLFHYFCRRISTHN